MKSFEDAFVFLQTLTPGALSEREQDEATAFLERCWDQLEGSSGGGMKRDKLLGRVEQMRWDPPELSFVIERHGAIVGGGSGSAELQSWRVNLRSGTAAFGEAGYRRVRPADARLDVASLASKVADDICERRQAPFLQWHGDREVQVLMGALITANNRRTQSSRARRFREALDELLSTTAWRKKGTGTHLVYQRAPSTSGT